MSAGTTRPRGYNRGKLQGRSVSYTTSASCCSAAALSPFSESASPAKVTWRFVDEERNRESMLSLRMLRRRMDSWARAGEPRFCTGESKTKLSSPKNLRSSSSCGRVGEVG